MAVSQLKPATPGPALREGRAPVSERLTAMLFLAALLHAIVILGLTFAVGGHVGGADTPQLDVLLVTNEVPEAQANDAAVYLAQRTQAGSGNTDEAVASASPASRGAPYPRADSSRDSNGNSTSDTRLDKPVLASSAPGADIRYFGQAPAASAADALPEFIGDTPGEPRNGHGDAVELLLRGKANTERWVTPDTRASKLAPYLAAWKRKVERVGNLNFPAVARSAGLSGSPVVEVQIGANGKLVEASVRRSSGHGSLDEAAMTILRLASPFDPFPPDLAAEYAQLRFAYQWDFVAGALQTGAVTASSDTTSGP